MKVNLNPGETRNETVKLDRRALFLNYYVKNHKWTVAPGDFILMQDSSKSLRI